MKNQLSNLLTKFLMLAVSAHLLLLFFQWSKFAALIPFHKYLDSFHALFLCSILIVGIRRKVWKDDTPAMRHFLSFLVLYAVWIIVGTILNGESSNKGKMLAVFTSGLTVLSFAYFGPRLFKEFDYRFIFTSYIVTVFFHTGLTIYFAATDTNQFLGEYISNGQGKQPSWLPKVLLGTDGIFGNPNATAAISLFAPLLALFLANSTKSRTLRIFFRTAAFAIGFGILLTNSRAAIATLVLASLPLLSRRLAKLQLPILAATIVGGISILFFSPELLKDRLAIWTYFISETSSNQFLFGYGFLGLEFEKYSPHNFLIANFAYFGFIGLTLILGVLIAAGRLILSIRNKNEISSLLLLLISVLFVHGMVEFVITYPRFPTNSMFWLVLGYCLKPNTAAGKS